MTGLAPTPSPPALFQPHLTPTLPAAAPVPLPQGPQYRRSQPSELAPVPHSPPLVGLLAGCGPAVGAQAPPVCSSGVRAGGQVAPRRSSSRDTRRCPHAGHRSRGQSIGTDDGTCPLFTRGSGAGLGRGYSRGVEQEGCREKLAPGTRDAGRFGGGRKGVHCRPRCVCVRSHGSGHGRPC